MQFDLGSGGGMITRNLREKLPIILYDYEDRFGRAADMGSADAAQHGIAFAVLCCAAALFELADNAGTDTSGIEAALESIGDRSDVRAAIDRIAARARVVSASEAGPGASANGVRERDGGQ
jgi:hypothetical protein